MISIFSAMAEKEVRHDEDGPFSLVIAHESVCVSEFWVGFFSGKPSY
jgi:hypothetical protein